jgi:hypothetical protein
MMRVDEFWLRLRILRLERVVNRKSVILWSHLGLGDQISSASLIENLTKRIETLIIPTKKRNLDFIFSTFGNWEGVQIEEVDDDSLCESREIQRLVRKHQCRVLVFGHHTLPIACLQLGEVCLNDLLSYSKKIPSGPLVSSKLRDSLNKCHQATPPSKPFAFVDHHPGTSRAIPNRFLDEIRDRGLEVYSNPQHIPLYALLRILDEAEELHLVASAPLCLALTIDARAKKRVYYRTLNQGTITSPSYPNWFEVDLRSRFVSAQKRINTLEILTGHILGNNHSRV